jgi:hypothetical protein
VPASSTGIKLQFSILFDGTIWNILPDEAQQRLLIETRNADLQQAEVYSLDLQKEELLPLLPLPAGIHWWLGLEAACEGIAILHTYANEQDPGHTGVYGYDMGTGEALWQNTNVSYLGSKPGQVLVQDITSRQVVLLSSTGGQVLQTSTPESELISSFEAYRQDRYKIPRFPLHYPAKHAYFEPVSHFIKIKTGHTAIEGADYLETDRYIIISYYTLEDTTLANRLLVTDTAGSIVLQDILALNLIGIGTDTFFILDQLLLFIKNKNELYSYVL